MPKKTEIKQVSIGVTSVRRSGSKDGGARPLTVPAYSAAEACALFGTSRRGGGEAFVRWLTLEKGIPAVELKSKDDWAPLLEEFAARPIHGHRRGRDGGNHSINKHHRR